jgi:hypothetical protein
MACQSDRFLNQRVAKQRHSGGSRSLHETLNSVMSLLYQMREEKNGKIKKRK